MKKIITALMIVLFLVPNSYAKPYRFAQELIAQRLDQQSHGFAGLEHQALGQQVNLRFYRILII